MKIFTLFLLLTFLFPGFASSQNIEGYLLITLGKDTVGVEHYQVVGNTIEAEGVRLVNAINRFQATRVLREDGTIVSNEKLFFDRKDKLVHRDYLAGDGDSIRIESGLGEKKWEITAAVNPHFLGSGFLVFGNCAKLVYDHDHTSRDAYIFYTPLGADPFSVTKMEAGKYKLHARSPGTFFVETNNRYEVVKVHSSGVGGGLSWIAEQVSPAVYHRLSKKWLTDPTVEAIPKVAPRKEESFTVRGTEIALEYGSPQKRGRQIFGGLVPFGKRWRTGSNWATHISFDQDLDFNGHEIPKGRYTLFTIPDVEQWTFLLNKQTGQWGTHYDESQEILRLPMEVSYWNPEMESFRIEVEETEKGGRIILLWDQLRASVSFQVSE